MADKDTSLKREDAQQLPLLRNNYLYMALAGALIILGFCLMLGASSGEQVYNPDIFSVRRIVVAPLITFIGFVGMAVAIIVKPRNTIK